MMNKKNSSLPKKEKKFIGTSNHPPSPWRIKFTAT
jgi:hypothetical protein